LDLSFLMSGVYHLQLILKGETTTIPLIKK
jgi:hypothetical protein